MTLLALPDPRPPAWTAPVGAAACHQAALPLESPVDPWPQHAPDLDDADRRTLQRACRALLEAVAGIRPLPHVEAWVTRDVLRVVARCARQRRRLAGRTFRAFVPCDGVAEVALRVADLDRERAAAVALRFELHPDGWVCTALELGPPLRVRR